MSEISAAQDKPSTYLTQVHNARRPASPASPRPSRAQPRAAPRPKPRAEAPFAGLFAAARSASRSTPLSVMEVHRRAGQHRYWTPHASHVVVASGCVWGAWLCSRMGRLLSPWGSELVSATGLALAVGVACAAAPLLASGALPRLLPPRPRAPRAATCPPAAVAALTSEAKGEAPEVHKTAAARPTAPGADVAPAPHAALEAAMRQRLEADTDLLYRVAAWALGYDVSVGRVGALALVHQGSDASAVTQRALAHTQQVILTASLESFKRLHPSRRSSFAEQLVKIVERHAQCLDDCYRMLTYPDEVDAIARRIVCPTEAWLAHEAQVQALTEDGKADIDPLVLCRLYEETPPRYHCAPEVQPETLQAYHAAIALRLSQQVTQVCAAHDRAHADVAPAAPASAPPTATDVGAQVDTWLAALCTEDVGSAWRPHFTADYLRIGAFVVPGPLETDASPRQAALDDDVQQLEVRKAASVCRDAAEQAEADLFYAQLFAPSTLYPAPLLSRENEECPVQAFFVAHMQQLPGAPDRTQPQEPGRGRMPWRPTDEVRASDSGVAPRDVHRLTRAVEESYGLLGDCDRRRALLERALHAPNTSRRHADLGRKLAALQVWGKEEIARYYALEAQLRTARHLLQGEAYF